MRYTIRPQDIEEGRASAGMTASADDVEEAMQAAWVICRYTGSPTVVVENVDHEARPVALPGGGSECSECGWMGPHHDDPRPLWRVAVEYLGE